MARNKNPPLKLKPKEAVIGASVWVQDRTDENKHEPTYSHGIIVSIWPSDVGAVVRWDNVGCDDILLGDLNLLTQPSRRKRSLRRLPSDSRLPLLRTTTSWLWLL